MITHDIATNTWSFTLGQQTYSGFSTKEQAQEALYDLERGQAPAALAKEAPIDADDTPIGTIHGCEVFGLYYDEPGEAYHGQLYGGVLEWSGKAIRFYADGNTFNISPTAQTDFKADIHLGDWQWVRALAYTDVVEQLAVLVRGLHGEASPTATADRIALADEADRILADRRPDPENVPANVKAWIDAHTLPPAAIAAARREMAQPRHRERRAAVLGQTPTGLPIQGSFDVDGTPFTVEAKTEHWSLNADDSGTMTLLHKSGTMIELDPHEVAALGELAQLLAGDTVSQLVTLARQWDALRQSCEA